MNKASNLKMEQAFLNIAIKQNDSRLIAIQTKRVEKAKADMPVIDSFEALMNDEWDRFMQGVTSEQ